mgnify:CR=1 FL=1
MNRYLVLVEGQDYCRFGFFDAKNADEAKTAFLKLINSNYSRQEIFVCDMNDIHSGWVN